DGSVTGIMGSLEASGRVFVVNPAGVIFGEGASVNVAQLFASTLNISDSDFQAGHYEFSAVGDSLSEVINNGTITTADGAVLIAKKVLNNGTIVTNEGGFVVMAAGDRVLLGEPGSNIIVEMDSVTIPEGGDPEGFGDVTNEGEIDAPAGEVVLAAGDIYSAAMSVSAGTGKVEQNGEIHVDGAAGNAGSVTLTAADEVSLGPESLTTANAETIGDGGEIIAYSPGTAIFEEGARVEAKGDSISGHGGLFEISGHEDLALAGEIDLTGSDGLNGMLVIDPLNLEIVPGDGIGGIEEDPDNTWTPVTTGAYLGIDTLEGYLGSANVTLKTEGTEGPEEGDVIFNAGRYLNSGVDGGDPTDNSLFVYAAEDILFMADNGIEFEGNGHVELYAGPEGSVTSVDRGKIPNIWTRAGDIIIEAGSGGIDLGSLQAGVETTTGDGGDGTVFNLRPGELRLATTEGGDITLEHLNVEGQRYGSVYVTSSGNLTINGDPSFGGAVQVRTNTTSEDSDSASFICLIAEKDVTITGDVLAYAKGTRESVAGVWIGAGTQTQEGGSPGTVTLNDKVTADASASGAVTSDATIRIYAEDIVWPTNESKYPEAKTQGSVSYSGIVSGYTESSDPDPVYYEVDEDGRVIKDENGDPVVVENPEPLLERKLGIGYRAAVEIDTTKDGSCLECVNVVRLFLPIAVDDLWEDSKNIAVIISVLEDNSYGPDQDGEGGALIGGTVLLADNPTTKGTLTLINGDTQVAYTPPDGWEGDFVNGEYTDTFEYYAVDADGDVSENTATVTITLINQYPDAVDDSYSNSHNLVLDKDGATGVILGVGTDTDADNDPLTATLVTDGTYGAVDLDTDGSFRYIPDEDLMRANTTLEDDTFTYEVSDGFGGTDTATVTIDLTNHAPDAVDDSYSNGHNLLLDKDKATGVILGAGTDTDDDNIVGRVFDDILTAELVTDGTYGTVDLNPDGSFTYTPDEDLMRANTALEDDTFTYEISDGFGGTDTATVTISLTNTAPIAQPDSYDASHNTILDLLLPDAPAGVITGVNPENRDYDPDNDDSIEGKVFNDILTSLLPGGLSSGQTSAGGTLELNPDGTFHYTPPDDFAGSDSFTYYVTDGYDISTVVEVAIAVGLPEIPPAPLPDPIVWEVGGCPTLMEWLADELGVEPENVQHYGLHAVSDSQNAVGTKTSIAYKGDIQWCLACSKLKDSVQVLT
ncbi:MAG: Ig-like domain-containing protein, partial [Planctomycetota bacterium]